MVNVDVRAPLIDAGCSDTVAPRGTPLARKATLPEKPSTAVVDMVTEPLTPACRLRVPGNAESAKSTCGVTVIVHAWVAGAEPSDESVARRLKLNAPEAVGVPVMDPELSLSARPGGKVPEREKVYGGTPPDAVAAEV
jgi:hypothetical protein